MLQDWLFVLGFFHEWVAPTEHNGRNRGLNRYRNHANSARQARIRYSYLVTENKLEKCAGFRANDFSVSARNISPARPSALSPLLPLPWGSVLSRIISNTQLGVHPRMHDANTLIRT